LSESTDNFLRHPLFVLLFSFFAMWLSAHVGVYFRKRQLNLGEDVHQDRDVIVAATLTLLALLIGFSFSMAIGRYDQRKNYEDAEANAIGTEYLRADLLPDSDAARLRGQLKDYLDQRILFYRTRDDRELARINAYTSQLRSELWSAVRAPAAAQPTPILALAISGMNDVLNSQGHTQAAWWNRIPAGAWGLMAVVAICSNLLVGYGARNPHRALVRLLVLPLVLCISFFLLSDIDTPRHGVIRVLPENLLSLSQSLNGR
jgi:lipopolysaccharide export LptBFGC system permease protein LptF